MAEGQKRADIKYAMDVGIVLKEDQSTGYITYGKVQKYSPPPLLTLMA